MGGQEWDERLDASQAQARATRDRADESARWMAERLAQVEAGYAALPEFMRWFIPKAAAAGLHPVVAAERGAGRWFTKDVSRTGWWVSVESGRDSDGRVGREAVFISEDGRLFDRDPGARSHITPRRAQDNSFGSYFGLVTAEAVQAVLIDWLGESGSGDPRA